MRVILQYETATSKLQGVKMYRLDVRFGATEVSLLEERYADREKFEELCRQCPKYGNLWSCPPYSFSVAEHTARYRMVYIVGAKIMFDEDVRAAVKSEDAESFAYDVIHGVRRSMDASLLSVETLASEREALFAGSCIVCCDCIRGKGSPCSHPGAMRYSFESLGYDVVAIARDFLGIELKWSAGGLPEYFTLIGGIMATQSIPDIEKSIAIGGCKK